MKYAISACLAGVKCRYDGKSKPDARIIKLMEEEDYILFCPECLGGLKIPRKPIEKRNNKMINIDGVDYTEMFVLGANKSLELIERKKVEIVILKEKSPSCGVHYIHNGLFDKGLVKGMGATTELLIKNNIKVMSEREYEYWRNNKR